MDERTNIAVAKAIVLAIVVVLYKELMFFTFDPVGAQASGLSTNLLNFGLMILIALTIVASLKAELILAARQRSSRSYGEKLRGCGVKVGC